MGKRTHRCAERKLVTSSRKMTPGNPMRRSQINSCACSVMYAGWPTATSSGPAMAVSGSESSTIMTAWMARMRMNTMPTRAWLPAPKACESSGEAPWSGVGLGLRLRVRRLRVRLRART
eukprot:scaffold55436_cov37-Phaeocystis_antarctica.AAC.2